MLRVQNDALALRSDEFRRVSSEKRELSERLESKRKELDVAWAEVKEMKARKRHSNSRGSGAVLDENMDKGGLGEDFEQELADIGSFSSMASRGGKNREGPLFVVEGIFDGFRGVASSSSSSSSLLPPLRSGSTPTHGKGNRRQVLTSRCEKTFQSGAGGSGAAAAKRGVTPRRSTTLTESLSKAGMMAWAECTAC